MTVAKKLYVGNLTYDTTEDNLVELFSEYGEVLSAQIIIDRDTNRSKGFGFVEMSDGADEAASALNGQDYRGRNLTVNEARPREDRGRGGYGGGGGGGGGRGGCYGPPAFPRRHPPPQGGHFFLWGPLSFCGAINERQRYTRSATA